MKKIFKSVMLLLFAGVMCLSVNAQVNVGSVDDPHDGSVLDLSKASNLGLLLPRVSLNDVSVWQLEGNAANGTGMMVYNIKEDIVGGSGSGVYVWDGAAWAPVKSTVTADVKVTGFTVTPDVTSVDVYVGGSQKFTVADFLPPLASYQSVSWRLSDSQGHTQILTPTAMECTVKGVSIGSAVLNIVSLDGNVTKSVTVNVTACTLKPDAPTGISFSKTSNIKLEEEITATATPEVTTGGAIPTMYNWTIPNNFEIVGSITTRTVTLKAKATATSITSAIKVNAENTCGTSADYSNTTAVSILNCANAPEQPSDITLSATSVTAGNTFTASITNITGVSYNWNVPNGLSITGGQGTSTVTYTTSTATTISIGAIKVTPGNDCGSGTARESAEAVTVNCGVPDQPSNITLSTISVAVGATFTASVTSVSGVTYTWNTPSGLSINSGQGTNTVTYTATTATTIPIGAITVTPSNSCGNSGSARISTTAVTICAVPAQPGTMTISATPVILGNTFTCSVPNVTGVTYTWNTPSGLSINSGQGTNTVTYTATTATTIPAGDIVVTPSNSCGNGNGKASTTAVIIVYRVINGAYSGPTTFSTATYTMAELTGTLGFAVSGNLLLYHSDFARVFGWNKATSTCSELGTGWRLPNIAELGNLQANKTSYGIDTYTYYWSSTEAYNGYEKAYAWCWMYEYSITECFNKVGFNFNVRCVKNL